MAAAAAAAAAAGPAGPPDQDDPEDLANQSTSDLALPVALPIVPLADFIEDIMRRYCQRPRNSLSDDTMRITLSYLATESKNDDSHGCLMHHCNSFDGKREGVFQVWSPSGYLIIQEEYHNGVPRGVHLNWTVSGQLTRDYFYNQFGNMEGVQRLWHPNGIRKQISSYVDGMMEGKTEKRNESGNIIEQFTCVTGSIHGRKLVCYDDGRRQEEEFYNYGQRTGKWSKWHKSGQLSMSCVYRDNQLHGLYREWYNNGQIAMRANYVDGVLEGECHEWYRNGNLFNICFFLGGRPHGEYHAWHKNGESITFRLYDEGDLVEEYLEAPEDYNYEAQRQAERELDRLSHLAR